MKQAQMRILSIIFLIIFSPIVTCSGSIASAEEVDKVIEMIKKQESLFDQYAIITELDYYKNNQKNDSRTCLLIISLDSTICLLKEPAVDKGKVILMDGTSYFLYFPKADRYIRISAKQTMLGNVSYGDLVKPPITKYYHVQNYKKEKNEKQEDIYIITFVLKDGIKDIPYYKKIIYYNWPNKEIQQIESFSRSDILLGRNINFEFQNIGGINFAVRNKIMDIRSPGNYVLQRNTSIKVVDLPSKYYRPTFMREVERYLTQKLGF